MQILRIRATGLMVGFNTHKKYETYKSGAYAGLSTGGGGGADPGAVYNLI
jgi:hypothetical protein